MKKYSAALLAAMLLLSATPAFADKYDSVDSCSPQEVVAGMVDKAERGVANITTGWVEVPKQVYVTYHKDGLAKALLAGPLRGVGMALVRTATGVLEVGTFFFPRPGFYEPIVEPAYVWQKE